MNNLLLPIINLYKESVKKVPVLKYTWGLISITCILSLIKYLKIENVKLPINSILWVIGFTFLIFFLAFIATQQVDKIVRVSLYILTYTLMLTLSLLIFGFAYYVFNDSGKPEFYSKVLGFEKQSDRDDNSTRTELITPKDSINKEEAISLSSNTAKGIKKSHKVLAKKNQKLLLINEVKEYVSHFPYHHNTKATSSIEITYSGSLKQQSDGLFKYNGGYMIVKNRGNICFEFTMYVIESPFSITNSEDIIIEKINSQLTTIVSKHKNYIIQKISDNCL